jgi:hypothetical protein
LTQHFVTAPGQVRHAVDQGAVEIEQNQPDSIESDGIARLKANGLTIVTASQHR